MGHTDLSKRVLRNCLHETVRVCTLFSWSHNLHDENLLVVRGIFEHIGALVHKGEREDRWDIVIDGTFSEHFLFKISESTKVKDVISVHNTVLHVHWVVARTFNVEKERVVFTDAIDRVKDLVPCALSCLETTTMIEMVDKLLADIATKATTFSEFVFNSTRDSVKSFESITSNIYGLNLAVLRWCTALFKLAISLGNIIERNLLCLSVFVGDQNLVRASVSDFWCVFTAILVADVVN